jgi:tripartite-type tricarboxylate transporter receptor subunit TctC
MKPARFVPGVIVFLVASLFLLGSLHAQSYPTKPLRMIVPFPAGGGSDTMGRALARKLEERLGQRVVVDNRVGAAGSIGANLAAKSAPDGYTILLGSTSELTQYPNVNPKIPYDPTRDFAPISLIGTVPLVLVVHPSLPVKSVKELIALAKKRPGEIFFGSAGYGATTHLAVEMFILKTGVKITHVPYKGSNFATADLVAGNIQMAIPTMPSAFPFIGANRLRVLAVSTAKRTPLLPDVPSLQEAGVKGYDTELWAGLLAPAGTPGPILARLHAETVQALKSADVKKVLASRGAVPKSSTPEEFAAFMKSELAKWATVVKEANVRTN